jgi:hypothetical protein
MKWLKMLVEAFVAARNAGYFARNGKLNAARQVILNQS